MLWSMIMVTDLVCMCIIDKSLFTWLLVAMWNVVLVLMMLPDLMPHGSQSPQRQDEISASCFISHGAWSCLMEYGSCSLAIELCDIPHLGSRLLLLLLCPCAHLSTSVFALSYSRNSWRKDSWSTLALLLKAWGFGFLELAHVKCIIRTGATR